MKNKTDRHNLLPTRTPVHHRWPFLPCDNGRFSGKLIYQTCHIPTEAPKMNRTTIYESFGDCPNRPGRRFVRCESTSILNHHHERALYSRLSQHIDRMGRDQAAAQARRLGILQINL